MRLCLGTRQETIRLPIVNLGTRHQTAWTYLSLMLQITHVARDWAQHVMVVPSFFFFFGMYCASTVPVILWTIACMHAKHFSDPLWSQMKQGTGEGGQDRVTANECLSYNSMKFSLYILYSSQKDSLTPRPHSHTPHHELDKVYIQIC